MNKSKEKHERVQDWRIAPGLARLVVVAVMVAVLVPAAVFALMTPRQQAQRAACMDHVRQLGLAIQQYSQDFREIYPWHVGASKPENAWCDLAILYPNYCATWKTFLCPASKDKEFKPQTAKGDKSDDTLGALEPADNKQVISYAYGINGSGEKTTAWTNYAKSTVRLLADKKAGIAIGDEEAAIANHGLEGRNVGYLNGHVQWEKGTAALDPDEDDDEIGKPDADDYKAWWSDPPWFAEGMDEDEEGEEAESAE